jgi:hypothetical protein
LSLFLGARRWTVKFRERREVRAAQKLPEWQPSVDPEIEELEALEALERQNAPESNVNPE